MPAKPGRALKIDADRRRRRWARYRMSFPVTITVLTGADYSRQEAHCKDLSEAGIGLLLAAEHNPGEVVSLQFCPPGARQGWEVRAVLRHRRGYHYGFEFLSLDAQQSSFLKTYLQDLERAD